MEESVKMALRIIDVVAAVMWAGAAVFAGYRIYQLATLRAVDAEVLKAETDSYVVSGEDEDSHGFRRQYSHPMYRALALVRYEFGGQQYTAVARHVAESSFRSGVDRRVRGWKPGSRIRVHVRPDKPDQPQVGLGLNLGTFKIPLLLVGMGYLWLGLGYVLKRVAAHFAKLMGG
jgi:hypothetical protein